MWLPRTGTTTDGPFVRALSSGRPDGVTARGCSQIAFAMSIDDHITHLTLLALIALIGYYYTNLSTPSALAAAGYNCIRLILPSSISTYVAFHIDAPDYPPQSPRFYYFAADLYIYLIYHFACACCAYIYISSFVNLSILLTAPD